MRSCDSINLQTLGHNSRCERSEPYDEREVTTRSEEIWAPPSTKETRAGSLTFVPNKASLYTRRIIPTNEKKLFPIHAHSGYGSDSAVSISKTVTTMLRHLDQDERESDGSRHRDSIKSVLVRKFAYEGARDFSDEAWMQKIFEGSTKKIIQYCKGKDGILCYLRAIQGHSGGIPIEPELMGYVLIPRNWKKYIFH